MNKVLLPLVFSVLLLFPVGAQNALAAPGQGTLFAVEPFANSLYTVDNAGVFTFVGNTEDVNANSVSINTLAFDHTTGIMYGGAGPGNFYIVNPTTAAVTLVGPTNNGNIDAMDFRVDGVLYASVGVGGQGSGGSNLATINPDTGAATIKGPFGVTGMGAIAFGNDGILYGVTKAPSNNLYTIDINTGDATFVTQVTGGFVVQGSQDGPASMQFACDGTVFLGTQFRDGRFGTLNIQNGNFAFLSFQPTDTVGGLTYDRSCDVIVGGEIIPLNTTALLLAGVQSVSMWMIPVVISGAGIGVFVISRRK